MISFTTMDARKHFADLLNRASYRKERIIISRRGKGVAGLVPVEDIELLERLEDEYDIAAARKALAEAGEKGTMPWEDFKKEIGL